MGKNRINFHTIWNEDHSDSFIGASLKEVLNNISCDQFCKMVRRAVHLSIMPREYTYVPISTMETLKKELFPDLSIKSLTSKYHYWKMEADDNSLGYTVGSFDHSYRESEIHICIIVDFRLSEDKKMIAHTEYSSKYGDKEYRYETLEEILSQFHDDVRAEYKLYEKLKEKYDVKKATPAKKLSRKATKKLKNAPTMTMEELERACELEPDGTYDDI